MTRSLPNQVKQFRKNLVLGGSGTIGKPLCNFLTAMGEEVINLDIKNNGVDLSNSQVCRTFIAKLL